MDRRKILIGWIPISHSSRLWSCEGAPSSKRTVDAPKYSRPYLGWWQRHYGLGDALRGVSLGPLFIVEQTGKAADYMSIIADQLHLHMASVLKLDSKWKWIQEDNVPCHKNQIDREWLREHNDEFQLMSWPPNSPDLNPIDHIWAFIERKFRDLAPPSRNILTLPYHCLGIWYSASQSF
ncbi:DDE_3 domain-containing protein [Trichonephila clavipes]|nr:DDE_3 domain-containing protein [Trichonephila clavipes]